MASGASEVAQVSNHDDAMAIREHNAVRLKLDVLNPDARQTFEPGPSPARHLDELYKETKAIKDDIHLLRKELGVKDARLVRLLCPPFGARLTEFSKEQSDSIGLDVADPSNRKAYWY